MLLDAIIIVLRETIEAGVLISLLLSMANRQRYPTRWLWLGLLGGGLGALAYAASAATIATWLDYVGLEVFNAALQYLICAALLVLIALMSQPHTRQQRGLRGLMALIVVLALTREGAEVLIFYSGFLVTESALSKPLTSGFVGLMIGMSVGALCYYLLMALRQTLALRWQLGLLTLVAAGMVMQATQLLIQADWLPAAMPLWNSSALLAESSVSGTLAYAVFGYEATPTALEVSLYLTALLLSPALMGLCRWRHRQSAASPREN